MHIAYSFNGENSEIDVNWTDSDGHSLIFYSIISEVCRRYGFNQEKYREIKFRERRRKKEKSFEEIEEVNLSTQFEDQLLLKVDLKIVCKN